MCRYIILEHLQIGVQNIICKVILLPTAYSEKKRINYVQKCICLHQCGNIVVFIEKRVRISIINTERTRFSPHFCGVTYAGVYYE